MPAPALWQPLIGSPSVVLQGAELRCTHAGGAWPAELGGELLPRQRGALSSKFQVSWVNFEFFCVCVVGAVAVFRFSVLCVGPDLCRLGVVCKYQGTL